ncbi:MAG: 2'-5' RNA ligase family protein [Frankia sp.]
MASGPDRMVDHWAAHPGWRPGRTFYTFYLTFGGAPEVAELAAHYQRGLDLPTLDLVPAAWLHLTVQGVGFTDEILAGDLATITDTARRLCAPVPPITMTLRPAVLVDQAAIFPASPRGPLTDLQTALQTAIASVLPAERVPDYGAAFIPHVTVAYSNTAGDAAVVHDHLAAVEPRSTATDIRAVHLVEISRDTHVYQWRTVAEIPLGVI